MSLLDPYPNIDTIDASNHTANNYQPNMNPPDSSSFVKLNIGSLNCRGLAKTAATSTRNQFIRYLRTRSLDLLALQETHASSTPLQDLFHQQFQAKLSIWSPHCGLVSFSPDISFSNSIVSICGRIISTTISHSSAAFEPFSITVVYFPTSRPERFSLLSTVLTDFPSVFSPSPSRCVILGDFNYTYANASSSRNRQAPQPWLTYIDDHFFNGVTPPGSASATTFQRGVSQSCIDYIMLSNDLVSSVVFDNCNTTYIQPAWSDHFLISSQLRLHPASDASSASAVGKGLWRAHPHLARTPLFKQQLYKALSKRLATLDASLSAAQKWEQLKLATTHVAKSFSRRQTYTLSRAEDLLHKKRSGLSQKLAADPSLRPVLNPQLTIVEDQLASLQSYHVDTLALRSGIRWRERGETSAGYLKRSVAVRATKKLIPPLVHPTSLSRCTTKEDMLDAAATYYTDLYSPDAVDPQAISELLDALPASLRLSDAAAASVVAPITFEDLVEAFSRAPDASSPGKDGLPYQIIRLIVLHPGCREITLATFNNALSFADIPPSWLESCVYLLPKKGALDLLKNWRPIALINTDAKVFTRILSARMIESASLLINPHQTGFVRGRFIADNGMLMKLVMEHAKLSSSSSIGLLLDQEKAYDRVHPTYLRAVLLRFGYPANLVDCISHLFFDTSMVINVNGFLSSPVAQLRGLKQGDPISPVLFNLAFEPLLRRILADSALAGYALPLPPPALAPATAAPTAVKMLAYADDIVCLLNTPADLQLLQQHLQVYSAASNALVNYHKTEVISLSGSPLIYGSIWRPALLQHNITSWHDARSPAPIRYLGFPLYTSTAQRTVFLERLLDSVRQGCQIHQQRGLSVRGRSTVLNSLLLSKLWHVLRVLTVPVSFFTSLNSIISSFLNFRIFPRISVDTACTSRSQGGLGLIHPQLQQSALQLRWLRPLLGQSTAHILSHPSIVLPRLVGFLLSQQPPSSNLSRSPPQQLDHRFSLLFPFRRPPPLRHIESSWSLLFKAIDRLPKDFSNIIVSASTCLEIPLAHVILPSSSSEELGRSLAQLPSSVAYTMGSTPDSCLRPKHSVEFSVHPNLAKKFLNLVTLDNIKLAPFFVRAFIPPRYSSFGRFPFQQVEDHTIVDIAPFVESLGLCSSSVSGTPRRRELSTRSYRRLCRPPITDQPLLPLPFSPHVPVNWFDFWLLPISHSCRNIWYRFLHHKIPHKSLLHRFVPDFFPSPSCALCSHSCDTLDHFLFSCPVKLTVWQTIQQRHLPLLTDPWTSLDLHLILTTLRFPFDLPPSALMVIAATLESIWISHWSFTFSSTPFTLESVLSLAESKILKYHHEASITAGIPHYPNLSVQDKWDLIKKKTKQVTQNFSRTHCSWRKAEIKKLQSERNNLLRRYRNDPACLNLLLPPVEEDLSKLQQEIVDTQRLRAGQRWHEKSEKSPGYIKQTLAERASKRTISSLKHPASGEQCLETRSKLDAAKVFYQDLYTEEEIDPNCVEEMLQYIDQTITAEDSQDIIEAITYDDIIQGSRRTPNGSSPGLDGICYEILHLLVVNPSCEAIIVQVFNEALSFGKFPKSWQESCIVLLPKKGDMTDLGNYRPITLIASDCKVFTRLLNSRVIQVASDIIGPHQSGFLRGRYIGDHGMALKVIVDNAREARWSNPEEFVEYAGIMLDNAKAYDRVHPQYLSKVLVKFGFPQQFVQCICKLFFDNSIYVNVNGFLTAPIEQRRGIRQGDSISPMLFNLAIEPFLLSVTKSTSISGYNLQHVKPISKRTNTWVAPPPLKVLAYADDVLTFVKSRAELLDLEERLKTYNMASNSKINYDNSVAFPLHGGKMTSQNGSLIQDYATNNLNIKWYDSTSTGFIKYLGYPIWFCNQQRDVYTAKLLGDITTAVERFAARQVSLYGRANIANTMILSKLWHVIRIVPLPKDVIKKINSVIYQFVMSGLYPPLKGNSFFLPRYQGGLGLIDIRAQQHVLQFRYLNALLTENNNSIPGLTYRLLVDYLKMSHDSPSHIIPLLFKTARYKNQLRGLHPYHMMFEAIDICTNHSPFSLSWSTKPNAMTLLPMPVLEILDFENDETAQEYKSRISIRESKVQDFFHIDQDTSTLQLKPRSGCKRPNIRNQIERGLQSGNIKLKCFVDIKNIETHLDLLPFVAMLNHQDRPLLQIPNKGLRLILLDVNNLDIGRKFNKNINKAQWKKFYHQNMHYSARNVWYRMIHKQCPSKSALFVRRLRNIEDDKCTLCNDTEDAKHLMVSCPHKNDIWSNIFEQFLGSPKTAIPHQVYQSIVNLNLKQDLIYNLDIKITIFDLFAATIRMIWRFHHLQTFEGVPFDISNVTTNICAEVMRLSDLKH